MPTPQPRLVVEIFAALDWVTARLKELRTSIANAVQDDDPRLTDARPPTGHRHDATEIDNLPTGGGGGGAGIDDTVTGPDTTWSSGKIATDRAPAMWETELPDYGGSPGSPGEMGMTVNQALDLLLSMMDEIGADIGNRTQIVGDTVGLTSQIVYLLPEGSGGTPSPGTLYGIVMPSGLVELQLGTPSAE